MLNLSAGSVLPEYPAGQYVTGDDFAPQQLGFALSISWLYRFHNKIAGIIQKKYPSWNDEQLFWYTRRWVNAIYENLVYNEMLPALLGWYIL